VKNFSHHIGKEVAFEKLNPMWFMSATDYFCENSSYSSHSRGKNVERKNVERMYLLAELSGLVGDNLMSLTVTGTAGSHFN
jgi:hypothetical protein